MKNVSQEQFCSIRFCDDVSMVLHADYPNDKKEKIILFRLTPESPGNSGMRPEEYYIAVPNGKSVALRSLPKGKYALERL